MWTHIATLGRDIYKYITFLKRGWRFDLCSIKSQPLEISLDVSFKSLKTSLLLKLCNCRDFGWVCGARCRTLGFWPSLENWRHTNAFYKLSEILLCCHFLDQNSTFFCSSVLFSRTIKRVSPYFITTNISQRDLSKNWDHKASFNWSWQKIMIMIVIMTDMPIFW